jgi:DNA polymerase (family 10)
MSITNYEIADHFSLLSKLMDIHGENSFKAKSYAIAAYNIEKLPQEIASMDDAMLFSMKGIGDSLGHKIREIEQTGRLSILDSLVAETPPGILDLLNIKGLGPKKIAVIWKEMGIESIGELEYACQENRLVTLKGFGEKTQESLLKSIAFMKQNMGFYLWAEVEEIAKQIIQQLQKVFPQQLFSLTGEIRRQCITLEYIDVLTNATAEQIEQQFTNIPDTIIELKEGILFVNTAQQPKLKFHLVDTATFYATLFLTTGSKDFIEAFTKQYTIDKNATSEEAIFIGNQLEVIPPALRESGDIIEQYKNGASIHLIQPYDIKGIIHSHSNWSDGANTIEDMAKAAIAQGFEYLVMSDHSQSAFYANGLSPERIAAQHREIDALNSKLAPFRIFKSIESDILNDGSLDYNDEILATFDIVIASVHSNLKMSQEKAMMRLLTAIQNPYTTILGHPTGRLLLSREGYPVDHKLIIDACAEHNVVVEINAHPRRLDIDWQWIQYAMKKGVLLSIDPDSHAVGGYHDVYYGVMAAQKGGLTAQQNLSSYTLKEMEAFLEGYKKKIADRK